ncbi:MAG: hypothetical protein JSR55_01980, partial [Proteobacteria bacterium]|nr:hypothetical protein [Pseudomonadota bacterium]
GSGITLTNSANSFATMALTSSGDASVYDATGLGIAGATATGNLTLA